MNAAEIDILWLGYEDVSGLWEVTWGDDDGTEPSRTARRGDLFVTLLSDGLIDVTTGPPSADFDAAHHLAPDEVRELLRDPRSWRGPQLDDDGQHVLLFRTTEAGLAAYRAATGWRAGGAEPRG
ncbi:hypothetical protein [Luteimicrobium subarcticum]|uniref:Uncharacterized protein n=1 Tax=Luteimicrobium subarcticum TaxID=620910 RepID=A0A2M8WT64_9MICO|nr:hypothetical protein [Luteimicrobium subarcticum]PJI94088.1 hypothetical protein CLV34_1574 [Luteimicrobium subarcticum]